MNPATRPAQALHLRCNIDTLRCIDGEGPVATTTVGFAIEEGDRDRLERLVKKYGGGNRSAFLRAAMAYMEAVDRAERLRALQAYGAERSARKGLALSDVEGVVHRVLSSRKRR